MIKLSEDIAITQCAAGVITKAYWMKYIGIKCCQIGKKKQKTVWQILYLVLLMAWVNVVRYNPIITTQQRQSELSIKQPYKKKYVKTREKQIVKYSDQLVQFMYFKFLTYIQFYIFNAGINVLPNQDFNDALWQTEESWKHHMAV